jgi:DnaJ-class molecular chaperone
MSELIIARLERLEVKLNVLLERSNPEFQREPGASRKICPVCHGRGQILGGYIPGEVNSTACDRNCQTCGGMGLL